MGLAKCKCENLGKEISGKKGAKRHNTKSIKETNMGVSKPASKRLSVKNLVEDE